MDHSPVLPGEYGSDGRVPIHGGRGREGRRRDVLVEVDIGVVERTGEASANGPFAGLTRRVRKSEARRPVVLRGRRRIEADDARDAWDRALRLIARTYWHGNVLLAQTK